MHHFHFPHNVSHLCQRYLVFYEPQEDADVVPKEEEILDLSHRVTDKVVDVIKVYKNTLEMVSTIMKN